MTNTDAHEDSSANGSPLPRSPDRRAFLSAASGLAMSGGLAAGYGTLGWMAARYLFPTAPREMRWMFVARAEELAPGGSLLYRAPTGEKIAIARQGEESFIALSSTCPHLGCQVRWEAQNKRFFCPCHNGTFDPSGKATGGPPGEAGQSLPRYPLEVRSGLLYIEVPVDKLGDGMSASSAGREKRTGELRIA